VLELILIALQAFHVLFLALHDWVPLARLTLTVLFLKHQTSHLKSVTEHMPVFTLRGKHGHQCGERELIGESAFVSRLARSQPKFLGLTFHGNKKPSRCG
jgi:hypothetical protein